MTDDLDDLLCRAQNGERAAFDRLVEATAPLVRSWLALYVRNLADVDDLAQEAYLHLYDHLGDYRPGSNGMAWLKAIARNQALGQLRAQQRREVAHDRYAIAVRTLLGDAGHELPAGDHPGLVQKLRECIARLSQRARDLIEQRYLADTSVELIAQGCGQSANQVSVTLWRTRKALGDCIEGGRAQEEA